MLIVTIAALVMAASLGWFAYRLMQEEQRRSEARVALLASALDAAPVAPASWPASELPSVAARQATPLSPASARAVNHTGVPEVVMLDDDSRDIRRFASEVAPERSAAMPAPVTRSGEGQVPPATAREVLPPLGAPLHRQSTSSPAFDEVRDMDARREGLFADVPVARPGDGRGVIAVIALVLVAVIAAAYMWSGGSAGSAPASAGGTAPPTAPATPVAANGGVPLELLSLAHERRGTTLVVRGVVRNPVAGSMRPGLAASVLLLDEAGGFLRSGRAALPAATLAPGTETPFAVELPSTSDVRRYRVTFRGADGALVPHADKRQ